MKKAVIEILYDGEFAGVAEPQKDTKNRIKDVLRMKPQVVFRTIEKPTQIEITSELPSMPKFQVGFNPGGIGGPTGGTKMVPGPKKGALFEQQFLSGPRILEQDPITKNFALPLPLGNSSYDSISLPAWDINFLYGSLSGSAQLLTSSVRPFLKIPQIDAEIIYKSYQTSTSLPKGYLSEAGKNKPKKRYSEFEELHEDPNIITVGWTTTVYPTDELYYDFDEDFIILEITEKNAPYLKENFEIEVFEIEEQISAANEEEKELLIPKYFVKPPVHTKNDLLMSFEEKQLQTEKELEQEFPDLDSTYVDYYFEISTDQEIDNKLMCEVKPVNKNKGVFISDKYDCLDPKENIPITNIYGEEEDNTSLPDCE